MTGVIKFFHSAGWGIITPHGVKLGDREREVFFHQSKVEGGHPTEGQEVEFSLFPNTTRASEVKLMSNVAYLRRGAYGTD